MADGNIIERKSEHLRIVAEESVEHRGTTLLEDVHLFHDALPELDFADIDTRASFFGKELAAPLMITSMTGGAELGGALNRGLAAVCQRLGIGFAVGSQRVMLRHPETAADFSVRDQIGDGVLLGNIGAVQLLESDLGEVVELASRIDADGLCVHLNAAQEMVQSDGNRQFTGILEAITRLNEMLDGRVLVKETGAGLSPGALEKLSSSGVTYVDVAGSGGTSWTKVESHRSLNGELRQAGELLADWGVPTAFSAVAARKILGEKTTVIASGGIESAMDIAAALALGADIAGMARPVLLRFIDGGEEAVESYLREIVENLRRVMLLSGCGTIVDLHEAPRIVEGRLAQLLAAHGWVEGGNR